MRPETRRAALRATARLALTVSVTGCQSAAVSGTAAPPADLGTPARADVDTAPAACATGGGDPGAVACCTRQLDRALGDGGAAVTAGADLACCGFLAAQNDLVIADGGGFSQNIPHRTACCQALGWRGTITCTPWGPPVPPAMPGEAAA